jgi:hypothetical protein
MSISVTPSTFQAYKTARANDWQVLPYGVKGASPTVIPVAYVEGEQMLVRDDWKLVLADLGELFDPDVLRVKHIEAVHPRELRVAIEQGFNEFFAQRLRGD